MIASAGPRRWAAALRWGAAALVVAAVHGGAGWLALNWKPASAEAAAGAPEPAIMIELAAVSVAPEAPAETLPPAPERVEPETPSEPVKETPPPETELPPPPEPIVEPPAEPPPPEPIPEPTPVQVPEPEIRLPELPAIPDTLAVLAPPPPPPLPLPLPPREIQKPVERKPAPKPRVVERKPVERPRQRQAAAPPPAPLQASAPNPAATGAAAQPSISTASWRGSLIAHLNRYKRFPGGTQPGTVQVAFAIDRSGNVLSARLAGSSGDPALDQEAVAMIRRASPVPAPPTSLGGGTISLAVPVRFSR